MGYDNAFYPWQHVMLDALSTLVAVNDLKVSEAISQHTMSRMILVRIPKVSMEQHLASHCMLFIWDYLNMG
jgi:hypothetical protein